MFEIKLLDMRTFYNISSHLDNIRALLGPILTMELEMIIDKKGLRQSVKLKDLGDVDYYCYDCDCYKVKSMA